ncbi:unnamed protein product [Brugia pahangi]|uniref:Uncharacterized protein n=1 Tax=Brugia pahangi TaxID=6280 RepID=A0A0N4THY0_BRUPA|nr:unnamed protein product [Brugia pahangi]
MVIRQLMHRPDMKWMYCENFGILPVLYEIIIIIIKYTN